MKALENTLKLERKKKKKERQKTEKTVEQLKSQVKVEEVTDDEEIFLPDISTSNQFSTLSNPALEIPPKVVESKP